MKAGTLGYTTWLNDRIFMLYCRLHMVECVMKVPVGGSSLLAYWLTAQNCAAASLTNLLYAQSTGLATIHPTYNNTWCIPLHYSISTFSVWV